MLTSLSVRHGSPVVRTVRSSVAVVAAAVALFAAAPRVQAQDMLDAKSATFVRDRYLTDLDTLHAKVMALAEAIPEDKYAWRPSAGVRSVSEAFMHIASEWYYFTPMSVAAKAPDNFGTPREALPKLEQITKKSEVISELNKSWTHCRAQVSGVDASKLTGTYKPWNVSLPEAAFAMAGDLHEHLGQLIAYARANGVTPPWSKK